jgi:glutamate-5-semialdehyde dehydrogenase
MSIQQDILKTGDQAVIASRELNRLSSRRKNSILEAMAAALDANKDKILEANRKDVQEAENAGSPPAMVDRLRLTDARFDAMTKGIRAISVLKDPIGARISRWIRPNGLEILKQRVPIGVVAIIYESRPNVTADAAALCIKSSNAVILRGGKESLYSNMAIAAALQEGGRKKGLPANAIQIITTTDHQAVLELVKLEGRVDCVIPRGGEKLIRTITDNARVPVIKHYKGVCHIYVDESANVEMAMAIIENAKCQRPGVCNAVEKVLVSEKIAPSFLPLMAKRLTGLKVELRGDAKACSIVPAMKSATEQDWYEEYLDLILTVAVVPSVTQAVDHINRFGSRHSDAIIAEDEKTQEYFVHNVDSATTYINASTRFTDGGEFGMGAEIGISTDKLHCRGPMGLEELTSYKYVVRGNGQVRT